MRFLIEAVRSCYGLIRHLWLALVDTIRWLPYEIGLWRYRRRVAERERRREAAREDLARVLEDDGPGERKD